MGQTLAYVQLSRWDPSTALGIIFSHAPISAYQNWPKIVMPVLPLCVRTYVEALRSGRTIKVLSL